MRSSSSTIDPGEFVKIEFEIEAEYMSERTATRFGILMFLELVEIDPATSSPQAIGRERSGAE